MNDILKKIKHNRIFEKLDIKKEKVVFFFFIFICPVFSQLPRISISMADTENRGEVSAALQILFLITILALAPSILIMSTSFVRIVIVFSILRRALGTQTMPPNQVLVGLALFLTFFIMSPVFNEINEKALQPYMNETIDFREGIAEAYVPMRNFMVRQVNENDLALFVRISGMEPPRNADDLPFQVIVPSFITSELKKAFIIGFLIYIPFLIIDMVIASILLSMGMMMLPPIMISMPFKIILFILVDGWALLVKNLVTSFH